MFLQNVPKIIKNGKIIVCLLYNATLYLRIETSIGWSEKLPHKKSKMLSIELKLHLTQNIPFKVCWLHWTLSESALLVPFHSPPFSCLRSLFHPEPCHLKAALPPSSRTLPNTGLVLPRSEGSRPALKCCRFSRMRPGISHSLSTPAQWQMEKSRPTRLSPVTCASLPLHALISLSFFPCSLTPRAVPFQNRQSGTGFSPRSRQDSLLSNGDWGGV